MERHSHHGLVASITLIVAFVIGTQSLWASTANLNSSSDVTVQALRDQILDLYKSGNEQDGEIVALQEQGAMKDGRIARLEEENTGLREQVRELGTELGSTQRKLEEAVAFQSEIKKAEPQTQRQITIWRQSLEDSAAEIAALERQVATLQGKITVGQARVVQNLQEAGLPPVQLAIAKCGEGDWACAQFTRSTQKPNPGPGIYPELYIKPSFSPSGIYKGLPEVRRMELAARRGEATPNDYRPKGYKVTGGKPVMGMSGVFLTFSSVGGSCAMAKLEKELARLDGGLERAFDEIQALNGRVEQVEATVEDLDRRAGADLALGLGGYALPDHTSFLADFEQSIPAYDANWRTGIGVGLGGATQNGGLSWAARILLERTIGDLGIGIDAGVHCQSSGLRAASYYMVGDLFVSYRLDLLKFDLGGGLNSLVERDIHMSYFARVSLPLFR